jgi:hypothetical protein
MHSNGFHLPKNYNPADFYIKTLAMIPTNKEECISNIKVKKCLATHYRSLLFTNCIYFFYQKIRENFLKSPQLSKLSDDLAQAENSFKNSNLNLKITNQMT